jgi:hypothetical protein
MKNHPNHSLFRIFSANDWNQSELISLNAHSSFTDPNSKMTPINFLNAEILRKFESLVIKNITLELSRTIWSNGLIILFPIIPQCYNLSKAVQVRS